MILYYIYSFFYSECGNSNFAFRDRCNRCNTQKPAGSGDDGGGGGGGFNRSFIINNINTFIIL